MRKEIAVFMHFQPISWGDSLRVHLSKKACYPDRRAEDILFIDEVKNGGEESNW